MPSNGASASAGPDYAPGLLRCRRDRGIGHGRLHGSAFWLRLSAYLLPYTCFCRLLGKLGLVLAGRSHHLSPCPLICDVVHRGSIEGLAETAERKREGHRFLLRVQGSDDHLLALPHLVDNLPGQLHLHLTARRKADGILQLNRFALVDLDLNAGRHHQRIGRRHVDQQVFLSSPSIVRTATEIRIAPVLGSSPSCLMRQTCLLPVFSSVVQILTQLLSAPAAAVVGAVFGTSWPCWAAAIVVPHPNANAARKTGQPIKRSPFHPSIDLPISTSPRFNGPVSGA